jgi:hypothetical protein
MRRSTDHAGQKQRSSAIGMLKIMLQVPRRFLPRMPSYPGPVLSTAHHNLFTIRRRYHMGKKRLGRLRLIPLREEIS